MSEHETGQVDTSAAVVYDELFVPALFGRFASEIADVAHLAAQESVLDVACGTGTLTRQVRTRTSGRVVGVDVSPAMLAVARRHRGEVTYLEADALVLPFEDDEFSVALSQFGLMFLPDPVAGVAEMARVADRGVVAVWDSIERSDGYLALQELFRRELGEDAAASLDAPFAMGATGVLEDVVAHAGIDEAAFATVVGSGRFASIDEWVTTEVRGWTLSESVTDDQLGELIDAARGSLGRFWTTDGCEFAMAAKTVAWG